MQNNDLLLFEELRRTPRLVELASLAGTDEIKMQENLRREFSPELVRLALTLSDLRKKAKGKFSHPEFMWFDRQGYEQATAECVAKYKAERFKCLNHQSEGKLGYLDPVMDLCCGIGIDTSAIASHLPVKSVDLDPLKLAMTKWNLELHSKHFPVELIQADVTTLDFTGKFVHLDPDRRVHSSSKAVRIEQYVPDLAFMHELIKKGRGGAIKLSPAVNFGGKFQDVEVELISLQGECKEATIWFGEMAQPGLWRATSLPDNISISGHPLSARAMISPIRNYIYDPDPAVVRAGLIDLLAEQLEIYRIDSAEEYLTSDQHVTSPFLKSFKVLKNLPFNEKQLRQEFAKQQCGQLEIKCRHIPVLVDSLRKTMKLSGREKRVLIICREEADSRGVICERV